MGGKGKGKSRAAPLALANGPSQSDPWSGLGRDPIAAEAIREIKEQLRDPRSDGRIWVDGWAARFQEHLGNMREFVESRPDKFNVLPGAGRNFTVSIVSGGGIAGTALRGVIAGTRIPAASQRTPLPAARSAVSLASRTSGGGGGGAESAALREITDQLKEQGGSGQVWIEAWVHRYEPFLGTLREFLEGHPEKVTVVQGPGRKFSVELARGAGKRKRQDRVEEEYWEPPVKKGKGKGDKGGRQRGTWEADYSEPPAKRVKGGSKWEKGGGKGWNPQVAEAVREIKEQMHYPEFDGRLWVSQWAQRFQAELGTLREFLESMPHKFTVIPGGGKKFTVVLS